MRRCTRPIACGISSTACSRWRGRTPAPRRPRASTRRRSCASGSRRGCRWRTSTASPRHQLDGPLPVRAAPGRLAQVLDNLLANALEASPDGGTVTLSARADSPWVELHLSDEGPGLSPGAARARLRPLLARRIRSGRLGHRAGDRQTARRRRRGRGRAPRGGGRRRRRRGPPASCLNLYRSLPSPSPAVCRPSRRTQA